MMRPIHIVLGCLFLLIPGLVGCSKPENKQASVAVVEDTVPVAVKPAIGRIAFYRVHKVQSQDSKALAEYAAGGATPENTKFVPADADSGNAPGLLLDTPAIVDDAQAKFGLGFSEGVRPGHVTLQFELSTYDLKKTFADYTADQSSYRTQFAVVLNGKILSAPFINSPIYAGQGHIEGGWTISEAEALIEEIRAGPGNDTP